MTSAQTVECDVGVVGLAAMGQNLALNFAEKGFRTAVFNRTSARVDECVQHAQQEKLSLLSGYKDVKEFVKSLKLPRRIIILIQSGDPVDEFLESVVPHLDAGDLLIDAGNEWYETTERRMTMLQSRGFRFIGMGVSGGAEGARYGPALLAGGAKESYALVEDMLKKVAAQSEIGPCVTLVGPGGAGNYSKMIHNGIEYGDMQLIAEAYALLQRWVGLSNAEIHKVFKKWNEGRLNSFLIRKTVDIFVHKDNCGDGELLDKVKDSAGSKGTGMWTVQEAAKRGIPCPTLNAALNMRHVSRLLDLRAKAAKTFGVPPPSLPQQSRAPDIQKFIDDLEDALYCSKICAYSQGMMLLKAASDDLKWNINLAEIARTWRNGCIIEAKFLKRVYDAYMADPNLRLLLLEKSFAEEIRSGLLAWRRIVNIATQEGIPVPGLAASLGYFDSVTCTRLPTNLIQAQRDLFGEHSYERVDQDGPFHSCWKQ